MITSVPISNFIYPQSGAFSYAFILGLDNTSGSCDFGFSGSAGTLNFRFANGRILDSSGRFLGAYTPDTDLLLSGAVSPTTYDVNLNGQPRAFGLPRATGVFSSVYVKPSGTQATFSLYVNGDAPSYSISPILTFNTGNSVPITGYVINNSAFPFRVMSGDYGGDAAFQLVSLPTGKVTSSGAFVFNAIGDAAGGLHSLPITLYTDFGVQQFSLQVSGNNAGPAAYFITLNGATDFTNLSDPISYICSYGDFNGSLTVVPILDYVSGAKTVFDLLSGTGNYFGSISGNLVGSGWIVNTVRVTGFAGTQSGVITTQVSGFNYATGIFSKVFSIPVTGWAFASGSSTPVLSVGTLTGLYTVNVVSGVASINVLTTGSNPSNVRSVASLGLANATGLFSLSGIQQGDIFYIGSGTPPIEYPSMFDSATALVNYVNSSTSFHAALSGSDVLIIGSPSGNGAPLRVDSCNRGSAFFSSPFLTGGGSLFSLNLTPSGTFSGQYVDQIVASGFYTYSLSQPVVGQFSGLDYTKDLASVWTLYTGVSSAPADLVAVPGSGLRYRGISLSAYQDTFYLQVAYNNTFNSETDIAILRISGVNSPTGVSLQLSGSPS